MTVILILIIASLAIALTFLAGFIWAVRSGQFEDTCTPSMRILTEDSQPRSRLPWPTRTPATAEKDPRALQATRRDVEAGVPAALHPTTHNH